MTKKPVWWPKNPYKDVIEEIDGVQYIRSKNISQVIAWNAASDAIWEVVEKKLEEEFNEGYGCGSNTASENT